MLEPLPGSDQGDFWAQSVEILAMIEENRQLVTDEPVELEK